MSDTEQSTSSVSLISQHAGRILFFVVAVLLLRLGFRLWSVLLPGSWIGVVVLLYLFATALALLVASVVDVDLDRWGHWIAIWVSFVLLATAFAIVLLRPGTDFGTDALLFSKYSAHLFTLGRNPFAESMEPAMSVYNTSVLHITPTIGGGHVQSLSYPAGSFLWAVPQTALDIGSPNLMLSLFLGIAATLIFLVFESPGELALVPIIAMIGSRNLIWTSIGGLIDVWWLLPLLIAMREWHAGRRPRSAFAFGIAAGTKQQVWPIAAFLAIWLWAEANSRQDFFASARTTISYGAVGFGVLNLPFLLMAPKMWALSVLTPLGSGPTLVEQGVGPTIVSITGLYALPSTYFSVLMVLALVVALGLYALYWNRVKWVAWLVPPLLFWFNYRSLMSYFTYFVPVAYYAGLCAIDARRESWPVSELIADVIGRLKAPAKPAGGER